MEQLIIIRLQTRVTTPINLDFRKNHDDLTIKSNKGSMKLEVKQYCRDVTQDVTSAFRNASVGGT